jgi:hypothetical protein
MEMKPAAGSGEQPAMRCSTTCRAGSERALLTSAVGSTSYNSQTGYTRLRSEYLRSGA